MPAKSTAQQKAAGAALSAKRDETPRSELKGASKSTAASMSEKAGRMRPMNVFAAECRQEPEAFV